jgi:hypothetical protein
MARGCNAGLEERQQRIQAELGKLPMVGGERAGPAALMGKTAEGKLSRLQSAGQLPPHYQVEHCQHFGHCQRIAGLHDWARMTCAPCALFRAAVAELINKKPAEAPPAPRELPKPSVDPVILIRLQEERDALTGKLQAASETEAALHHALEVAQQDLKKARYRIRGFKASSSRLKLDLQTTKKELEEARLDSKRPQVAAKAAIKRSAADRKKRSAARKKRPPVKFNW